MNGVIPLHEVRLKQTSKGVWHCDGLTVASTDLTEIPGLADTFMSFMEDVLKKHNEKEDQCLKEDVVVKTGAGTSRK